MDLLDPPACNTAPEPDVLAVARTAALSWLNRLARPLPPGERALYRQTAQDILNAVDSVEEIRRARTVMALQLADTVARMYAVLPEAATPWRTVLAATVMAGVLVLGIVASIVQIATTSMPIWLVIAIWTVIVASGVIGGWWRWREIHDTESSSPVSEHLD